MDSFGQLNLDLLISVDVGGRRWLLLQDEMFQNKQLRQPEGEK